MLDRAWLSARTRLALWFAHAALACALVAACVGQIGDAGGSGSPSASSSGMGSSGSSGSTASSGTPSIPFEPLSVPVYMTKVKTMLTGLAPTQAEINAVTADASALSDLVTAWMQLPQYTAKMELFFADAFQQSQAQDIDFAIPPFQDLLLNLR
jgi:hypothetical protein